MGLGLNMYSFEFALKKRSYTVIFRVKIVGVTCADFSHKFRNSPVFNLAEEQVKMIGHKAKAKYFHQHFPFFSTMEVGLP